MKTLKEMREYLGLNQGEVSKQAGISAGTLSLYETGSMIPQLDDCITLERNFGQKLKWKDDISDTDKESITETISILSRYYPLQSVLNFAQKWLKEGQRIGEPAKFITFFASKAIENVEPMINESEY
ncbi:MAG: helix-turn-helix transcriptional regulator [Bacteroidales bacterium]|nr:helix-turn-helix transcriptional regulator [Bacteroidales bacterium]